MESELDLRAFAVSGQLGGIACGTPVAEVIHALGEPQWREPAGRADCTTFGYGDIAFALAHDAHVVSGISVEWLSGRPLRSGNVRVKDLWPQAARSLESVSHMLREHDVEPIDNFAYVPNAHKWLTPAGVFLTLLDEELRRVEIGLAAPSRTGVEAS